MKSPKPLGCADCNAIGLWHCSDPIHCGGMRYEEEKNEKKEKKEEEYSSMTNETFINDLVQRTEEYIRECREEGCDIFSSDFGEEFCNRIATDSRLTEYTWSLVDEESDCQFYELATDISVIILSERFVEIVVSAKSQQRHIAIYKPLVKTTAFTHDNKEQRVIFASWIALR